MDNINMILAENIQKFRKEKEMTQEELAGRLGVTYQAVSKWENAKSAPDIFFLPILADVFGCSIDTLFSRNGSFTQYDTNCSALPWDDDDVIRGVVCLGRKILQAKDRMIDKFTFEIIGDAKKVESKCNVTVHGSVNGGCNAHGSVEVGGYLTGGCNCGGNVTVGGSHTGGLNCGANVDCGGDIIGGINCGANVSCHNVDAESIRCGALNATGNIKAERIKVKGDLICQSLNEEEN